MAARSTISVLDRAATPVAHLFTPDGDDANGIHVFTEKTGVPAADRRATLGLRYSNGKYRPSIKFQLPVVQTQTINGVSSPVQVRSAIAELNFTFDATSTDQERKDAVSFIEKSLAASQTMINDMIVNLSDVY